MKKLSFFALIASFVLFVACSDDDPDPTPPTGSVQEDATVVAGGEVVLTGTFQDAQGITSVSLSSTDLGLNETVNVANESSYSLSYTLSVGAGTAAGTYTINVIVTNSESLTAEFTITLTVTDPPCPVNSFDDATANAASAFSDVNDTYFFEDYTAEFQGIAVTVNDDCSQITFTGDFLDWGTIDESFTPVLNMSIGADDDGDGIGALTFTEEVMGAMADGFTYRMSASDMDGSYDTNAGTITIKIYIDYQEGSDWTYWYTNTTTFTVQ